jgi:hypothetical protein
LTIKVFGFPTVFMSVFIFTSHDTVEDFGSTDSIIIVIITVVHKDVVMLWFDFISKIDLTISIGIEGSHQFTSDVVNIITVPSIWAVVTITIFKWDVTISMTITWTVFISPDVFDLNDTIEHFTFRNRSIIVNITVHN